MAANDKEVLVKADHVKVYFKGKKRGQTVKAVDDVSFEIMKGETFGVVGESGCGKSTLGRTLIRLQQPTDGHIYLNGTDIAGLKGAQLKEMRKEAQIIFQDPSACLNPRRTIKQILMEPFEIHNLKGKIDVDAKIMELLQLVGLDSYHLSRYPHELSGGQKQRVGIARALTTTPDILLCDEATSALDPQTTESILKLLKKINKEMGVTILLITHQMQVVQMICNKVAVMENGKVVESGSVLDVFGKPQALVTKRFVQTVINDQIPESIVSLVKEQKEHFQVERLKFIGSSVKRPVISDICQVEGIVVNILGATVQELQENVMCVFILQLIGSEDKICEAEKQIDANGVIRERVEVI